MQHLEILICHLITSLENENCGGALTVGVESSTVRIVIYFKTWKKCQDSPSTDAMERKGCQRIENMVGVKCGHIPHARTQNFALPPSKFGQTSSNLTRSGTTQGMAKSDRSTIDVDLVQWNIELVNAVNVLGGQELSEELSDKNAELNLPCWQKLR